MTINLSAAAAAFLLGSAALAGPAMAADRPLRAPIYYAPPPVGLDPDEVRDYQRDQLERRQEMERQALRFRQKVERRNLDPDDDED